MFRLLQQCYIFIFSLLFSVTVLCGASDQNRFDWDVSISCNYEQKKIVASAGVQKKGDMGSICTLIMNCPLDMEHFILQIGRVADGDVDFSNPVLQDSEQVIVDKLMRGMMGKILEVIIKECERLVTTKCTSAHLEER